MKNLEVDELPGSVFQRFQKVLLQVSEGGFKSFKNRKNIDTPGKHVFERSPRLALQVFARHSFQNGDLSADQYEHLCLLHDAFSMDIMKGDSYFYNIRSSTKMAYGKIIKRGRKENMNNTISEEHLS